jgi:hypothetical protein
VGQVCTLSWTPTPGGYALAMNRDERRTRARGLPPQRVLVRDLPVLMPTDPEGGGTWAAVNARGLGLALLNRYEESPSHDRGPFTSRGRLIREMAGTESPDTLEADLRAMSLEPYRPFTLAVVGRGEAPRVFDWDGRNVVASAVGEPGLVRASSGSDQLEAERARGELFRAAARGPGGLTPESLALLHRGHEPVRGPISICMHRNEAVTVSLSLITVDVNRISIFYVDGSPGETPGGALYLL